MEEGTDLLEMFVEVSLEFESNNCGSQLKISHQEQVPIHTGVMVNRRINIPRSFNDSRYSRVATVQYGMDAPILGSCLPVVFVDLVLAYICPMPTGSNVVYYTHPSGTYNNQEHSEGVPSLTNFGRT